MAQRFVLQCVLAMFAEDRGLLPDSLFVRCVQDCVGGESSYDVISRGLFGEMNAPGITAAGRFAGVDYFNGGLFSTVDGLELTKEELKILEVVALEDWSMVRPAIFGSIFESAIDQEERHARGIHYTSEADIMKIVRPTISRFWEERIEQASTIKDLEALQGELRDYRVLDPACGSGNFLYLAYQELKRIEQELLEKIRGKRRSSRDQIQMGFVTPLQFFGIDINPFAVELARVTLMIARKVAIDRLELIEPALPLDSLDENIVCDDALFTEWPKADAIIGNPPFLGGRNVRLQLGDEYVDRMVRQFPQVKDAVDFCTYWFRLSHERLGKSGRAGLVGTNSISQGLSRKQSLDFIISNDGSIHEAISTQPWSGEANVHVSIINWSNKESSANYLDHRLVDSINSSLSASTSVTDAQLIQSNSGYSFIGIQLTGKGFFIDLETMEKWGKQDPKNLEVVKLFSMGRNLASIPNGVPDRWVVDFNDLSIEDAMTYEAPFKHVLEYVKPVRDKNRRAATRKYWWQYGEKRPGMRATTKTLRYFFAVPRVSKWEVFIPFKSKWLPGDLNVVIASDDFYILGLITSETHRTWVKAQSSTLEDRTRYTPKTCFETFPFPQTPLLKTVEKIRETAIALHEYRSEQMEQKQWGITKLYNAYFDEPASQLYKLHKKLDKLVLDAYGFDPKGDRLEQLLELNLELAAKEKRGESVVGPWAIDNPPKRDES
ncbi:MAG: DNA methyltransferase [Cyanophyceae cyanobacterium]